ncbi:MAG: glycosyltransferase [Alphaproteobacteria bacterium]|nr:glycosyltransferase [Alphaproteobacteria bacterium]
MKFIAYRDILLPASEGFIPRQYQGFEQMAPIWLGSRSILRPEESRRLTGEAGSIITLPWLRRELWRQGGMVPREFSALMRQGSEARPVGIHANFGRGGALSLPLAERYDLPLVVTYHGGDATKDKHYQPHYGVSSLYLRRLPRLLQRARAIVCVSEFIRDSLRRRGFPSDRLVVNPYGVAPVAESDWADYGGSQSPPYLFFAGRLVEKKGVDYLLQAFAQSRGQFPNLELVIAGSGELEASLRNRAREISTERIRFVGWQSPDQLLSWRRGAAAIVIPSVTSRSGDAEGMPNVVLEAMAQGCAVIGSRHAGITEAINHGRSGLLVAERDVEGLAEAIAQLVSQPHLARRLGAAARQLVAEQYDATQQSRKLEQILLDHFKP